MTHWVTGCCYLLMALGHDGEFLASEVFRTAAECWTVAEAQKSRYGWYDCTLTGSDEDEMLKMLWEHRTPPPGPGGPAPPRPESPVPK